jgi:apolipoprotein D and lipocalin family protein
VPIASQVDVSAEDVIGIWQMRASFEPLAKANQAHILSVDGELILSFMDDEDPLLIAASAGEGGIDPAYITLFEGMLAQGRLAMEGYHPQPPFPEGAIELWILWSDFARRTMAIGTPDGSFGFILDRNPTGGEDRIAAALDILQWMGYRTEEMIQ